MKLEKPIVFFDVETTGLSLSEDRIIEISMIKLHPDGEKETFYTKLNPEGRAIHPKALEKHGIKPEDLLSEPKFVDKAEKIHDFIKNCDLGGYNCQRFDVPLLIEEFLRVKIPINVKSFKIIDVYKILLTAEPRTLEETYKRFLKKDMEGAHGAEADIIATMEILDKLEEFFDLPDTAEGMSKFIEDDSVDLENKLKRTDDGNIVFNFGKHRDKTVRDVYYTDPRYYDWIIEKSDMTRYTKAIFRNVVKILRKK